MPGTRPQLRAPLKIYSAVADTACRRVTIPIPTLREPREAELSIFTQTQVGSASNSSLRASHMKG
jgi:hypothetical protein